MKKEDALAKLKEYEAKSFALGHAMGLLYYDGATTAPKDAVKARVHSLGTISGMAYDLTTSPETVEMLEALIGVKDELDEITRRKVTELYRDYDRTRKIPADEYVEYQRLVSEADSVWHDAKAKNDYSIFEPYLQEIFDTTKKIALYMEPDKKPYETMLDMYERGLDEKTCDEFFASLRRDLVPLISKVKANASAVDNTPLKGDFPIEIQRKFSDFVMGLMKIDRNRCIIGETEHPFTTNFSKYDVRITTNYHADMFASSLYSVVHEGGHALYELHTSDKLAFSALGTGVSMAIHESQSRFYENIIGRSREFCALIFPWLRKNFAPRLDGVSEDEFYRMINKSEPSLIRTEADELTYPLHIMIRYELEKKMFAGEITAKELPAEWNRLYKEYLGVDVPSDTEGVLQDSHWSNGNIGYFPSYAIGSAYGAQYLHEMEKDFDVYGSLSEGSTEKINAWLEDKIWKYGCMKDPVELFESVCGKFDPSYYVKYLEKKFGEIYHL